MKKLKVIIAVLMCSVIIIVGSVPASALVGELTLGTGALLGIVITGLLASGVAIQAGNNGGLEGAAQAILDNMTPQMQQRIAALKVTEVGGQLLVHWTAQTWREFTEYVKANFVTSGATTIPNAGQFDFMPEFFSAPHFSLPVTYQAGVTQIIGNLHVRFSGRENYSSSDTTRFYANLLEYHLSDCYFLASQTSTFYLDWQGSANNSLLLSFPYAQAYNVINLKIMNPATGFVSSQNNGAKLDRLFLNGVSYQYLYNRGIVLRNVSTLVETVVSTQYTTVADWVKDCMTSGHYVGTIPGTNDYVNPSGLVTDTVSVDVFPNEYVGDGTDSLPDVIPDGTSIAIPIPGEIVGGDTVIIPDIPGTLTDVIPQDIIKDVTIDTSIPDVAYPDMPELPDDGSEDSPDDKANKMRFPSVAKEKFPFCIPFDFFNAIQMLSAPAQIPEYDIPFVVPSINFRYNVHLDFSDFETVAKVLRWFLSAGWILTLILITKSIIK